jgi:ATP-binding cassette subfamily C protein CydC
MSRLGILLARERRRQRGRLAMAAACAAAAGAASVLLLGLSGWFISGAALAGVGGAAAAGAFNYLLPSAGIRLFAIIRTGARYGERIAGHDAALRALARVRPALFAALAAAPPAAALAFSTGEAVARMTQDVDEVEAGMVRRAAPWAAAAAATAAAIIIVPAGIASLGGVLATIAVLVLLTHRLAAAQASSGVAVATANGKLKEALAQWLSATQELRAYGLEDWAAAHAAASSEPLLAAQQRAASGAARFELLQATAGGLAAMLALALASRAPLPFAAMASLGALALLEILAAPLRGLLKRGHLGAAEARLDAMLGGAPPSDPPSPVPAGKPTIHLRGCKAHLLPGCLIGITGPSGCGKTSLLQTLVGLRAATPGTIHIIGRDIATMPAAWLRPLFSLAPQDAALLAGTVRENLLLADPSATEAELWGALRTAAIDDRIAALPKTLDCWLGEGGLRLSGGERRRLSLARALLRPAPWLLLDEQTEGLDAATEAIVVARLATCLRARGSGAIIVSHRRVPLEVCDQVIKFSETKEALLF